MGRACVLDRASKTEAHRTCEVPWYETNVWDAEEKLGLHDRDRP
jgi:hypothetical protein